MTKNREYIRYEVSKEQFQEIENVNNKVKEFCQDLKEYDTEKYNLINYLENNYHNLKTDNLRDS